MTHHWNHVELKPEVVGEVECKVARNWVRLQARNLSTWSVENYMKILKTYLTKTTSAGQS
jgi:hypothetical protein